MDNVDKYLGEGKKLTEQVKWKYKDARGVWQMGTVEKTVDKGGTDITYFFRNQQGGLDVIAGPKLKRDKAGPIYKK